MRNCIQIIFILLLVSASGCRQDHPAEQEDPVAYLKAHPLSPEDYVMSKFEDHNYIFIGEYHRIRHDVELILHLIPRLYDKGIYTLGIEFGDYRDQHLVDSLLALPHFDRELAKKIMFRCDPLWGYKEYIDIYRVAWEVNHRKTASSGPGFRVVNLGAYYDPCKKGGAWKDLDPDRYMAEVVFKEIVAKSKKALIYSGNHHAFTRYHQPLYSFRRDTLLGYTTTRMGNIVYDSLKDETFNIYLHAGWISDKGWDAPEVLPVNGSIDSIMAVLGNKPVGFDVIHTPLGKLTSTDAYYALGYPHFTLDEFCDGYIWQKPFREYQPITMEPDYITPENIGILKKHLTCIGVPENLIDSLTVENANILLFEDIREHFRNLMK